MTAEYHFMLIMAAIIFVGVALNLWQQLEEDDFTPD